jgi:O-antigen ligase
VFQPLYEALLRFLERGRERRLRGTLLPLYWPQPTFGAPTLTPARRVLFDASPLVATALFLGFVLPPRLVVSGIGAAGRPVILLGFGLLVWWVATRAVPGLTTYGRQPVRWVFAAFLAAYLASYIAGYSRGLDSVESSSADRTLLYFLALTGLALATADGISSRARLDRLLQRTLLGGVVMALVGEIQFIAHVDLTRYIRIPGLSLNSALIGVGERGGPAFARVAGTAGHYIEYGVLLSMLLPLAIHYALFADTANRRLARWVGVLVLASGIPFSISRSAILALAAGLLTLLPCWTLRRQYNALLALVVFTIGMRALKPGLLGTIRSLFTNVENDPSIANRTSDYEAVSGFISERPWLGRGQGTFTPAKGLLLDNQFLGTLVSGGVLGVLTLVALFFVGFSVARRVRRNGRDEETRHLGQALAAVLVVAMVSSFTFDSFAFSTFAATLFVVVGATGALWRLDRTDRHRTGGIVPAEPVLRLPRHGRLGVDAPRPELMPERAPALVGTRLP